MKFFALAFLVIGSLISDQAFAGDDPLQPLSRAECDKAAMAWDENANVCQSAPEVATSHQPLTREECGKAGMKWSDDANVCGGANEAVSEVTTPSQPLTRADCDNRL